MRHLLAIQSAAPPKRNDSDQKRRIAR